jgi:hypothetical protein
MQHAADYIKYHSLLQTVNAVFYSTHTHPLFAEHVHHSKLVHFIINVYMNLRMAASNVS